MKSRRQRDLRFDDANEVAAGDGDVGVACGLSDLVPDDRRRLGQSRSNNLRMQLFPSRPTEPAIGAVLRVRRAVGPPLLPFRDPASTRKMTESWASRDRRRSPTFYFRLFPERLLADLLVFDFLVFDFLPSRPFCALMLSTRLGVSRP